MCPKPAIELMAAQHGTDRQPSQHAGPDEGQPGSDVGREHARVITRDPAISNRSRLRGQADTVALVGEVDAHRPCIEVLDGRCRGRVFELVRRHTVVGRSPGADLRIDDAGVSRRHIKLSVLDDGSVVAHDMRSTNGMIVNGERCDKVTLREGDLVRLGPDALLRFTTCGLEAARARAQPSPESEASTSSGSGVERTLDGEDQRATARRPKLEDLPLSARQIEVGRLVATGLTNAAIAERLGISHRTVTSHLDHIYARLGIGSRAALARWIAERGLLGDSDDQG